MSRYDRFLAIAWDIATIIAIGIIIVGVGYLVTYCL